MVAPDICLSVSSRCTGPAKTWTACSVRCAAYSNRSSVVSGRLGTRRRPPAGCPLPTLLPAPEVHGISIWGLGIHTSLSWMCRLNQRAKLHLSLAFEWQKRDTPSERPADLLTCSILEATAGVALCCFVSERDAKKVFLCHGWQNSERSVHDKISGRPI